MAAGDITRADGSVRKAGSSPFRSSGGSSSSSSSSGSSSRRTIKAGSGNSSPLQDKQYKKDLKEARESGRTVDEVRKDRNSSGGSSKNNLKKPKIVKNKFGMTNKEAQKQGLSPAAWRGNTNSSGGGGTSTSEDPRKIKTTAERQKEARIKAGGGTDYSDIPEDTAVTRERQSQAVRESYEKGSEQYEQDVAKYSNEVTSYAQRYGVSSLTPEQLEYVDYGKLITAQQKPDTSTPPIDIPQRFDLGYNETQEFAGQETRRNVQLEEQQRREQQIRAIEAMSLQPDFEAAAAGYEQKVGSALRPLTSSPNPVFQFAGGAVETFAYAPTGIPRLALGLAREPTAVAGETALTQIETLKTQPARGAGQISAMLFGPKAIKGATKTLGKFPYRLTRTGTEPGILLKTEMPVGSAAEVPKAPTQYTIPTLESAPKGIAEPMRGKISGKVSEPVPKQPSVFTGRETQPGIVETFVKTTPEQLQQLQRKGVTFQDKGFGSPIKTDYGSFRVVEPFGKGKPGKAGPIQPRITGPEPRGRKFPFRIERKQGLTPAELEIRTGRTIPGNVFETRAGRPKPQIELTGKRQINLWESESGAFRPTRTQINEPSVYGELFQEPITHRVRPQTALKTRQQPQSPMLGDLQAILDQSRARVKPKTQATVRTTPKGKRGMLHGFLPTFRTGAMSQSMQIPTIKPVPQFNIRTKNKPSSGIAPTPSSAPSPTPAPMFSPKSAPAGTTPRSTVSPVIPRPTTTKPPRVLPKRKRDGKEKKSGKKTGFEFYDIKNPLAGFEQVFKNIGGR